MSILCRYISLCSNIYVLFQVVLNSPFRKILFSDQNNAKVCWHTSQLCSLSRIIYAAAVVVFLESRNSTVGLLQIIYVYKRFKKIIKCKINYKQITLKRVAKQNKAINKNLIPCKQKIYLDCSDAIQMLLKSILSKKFEKIAFSILI